MTHHPKAKLSVGSCQLPTYTTCWPCNSSCIIAELPCFGFCHWWWISNKKESNWSSRMIAENTKKSKPYSILCYLLLRKQVSRSEQNSTINSHARLSKESTTNSFEPWTGLSNLQGEDILRCCCSEHQMHVFQSHHSPSLWSWCYFLHSGSLCLIHLCCKKACAVLL